MNCVIGTHKQIRFGRLSLIQVHAATCKAWLARLAREQAAQAIRDTQARPRRYLAPR